MKITVEEAMRTCAMDALATGLRRAQEAGNDRVARYLQSCLDDVRTMTLVDDKAPAVEAVASK